MSESVIGNWRVGGMYCDASTLDAICDMAIDYLDKGEANFVTDARFFSAVKQVLRAAQYWNDDSALSWWQRFKRDVARCF